MALPGLALAVGALLAPALASLALEDTPGRPASRTMIIMGVAASIRPVWTLVEGDWSVGATLSLLSDPAVLLMAWFASGLGWMVAALAETAARLWLTRENAAAKAVLMEERQKIMDEWGDALTHPPR